MVRFLLALALGLQPALGQFCGIQASCSSCLSVAGCVWNFGVCLSTSAVTICGNADCINVAGLCPVLTAPVVYAGASLPISASLNTFGGPFDASASIYARPSVAASIYPSVYSPPLFPPAPIYPAATPFFPAATPIYSTSSLYSAPIVSADAFTAPSFADTTYLPPVSASFAAPVYASGNVYGPGVSAGFSGGVYGGGNFYDNNNNGGLFGGGLLNQNGPLLDTEVRNNVLGTALDPLIPGIGGVLSTANSLNVARNAPEIIDNTINGRGYRRDPVGSFVRNSIYSSELGGLLPGISGSLDTFNKFNLYSSLLGR